jgi:hypothetical protein
MAAHKNYVRRVITNVWRSKSYLLVKRAIFWPGTDKLRGSIGVTFRFTICLVLYRLVYTRVTIGTLDAEFEYT